MSRNEKALLIGHRLVQLRDLRPRTKVARAMGISYSGLTQYEHGLKIPNDETKRKIADYYRLRVEDIFLP